MRSMRLHQFRAGIDRRWTMADPHGLAFWDLLNCHVTPGGTVRKRPGLRAVALFLLPPAQAFLAAKQGGRLHVATKPDWTDGSVPIDSGFYGAPSITPASRILHALPFGDGVYLIVDFDGTGATKHEWLRAVDMTLTANQTDATSAGASGLGPVFSAARPAMTTLAERIYAADAGGILRMSDVLNPLEWAPPTGTQTQLAGFINAGAHQTGAKEITALGRYRDKLVVFFRDSAQLWRTDPDPKLHALDTIVDGIGCRWPRAVGNLAGDCIALDDSGFRSIAVVDALGNISDVDVGSPVDALVREALAAMAAGVEPVAAYYPAGQQWWCAIGREIYVLTFSRTAQMSAWSRYTAPGDVLWIAEMDGRLFLLCRVQDRSNPALQHDVIYEVDANRYDDDVIDSAANPNPPYAIAQPFLVRAEFPFLDLGMPGALKRYNAWDAIVNGTAAVRFRLEPNDPAVITDPVEVSGATAPGATIPLFGMSTHIAPVIEDQDSRPWELSSLTIYFDAGGLR